MTQNTQSVLRIDASMRKADSASRLLVDQVIKNLNPTQLVQRDLATSVPPLIDETWIGANFTAADQRSAAQQEKLRLSDTLVKEIDNADSLVIGVPMYNFGVPAALKAWIDQICRAGLTFRYTENGPQGLMQNKRAVLVAVTGGTATESAMDFAIPYMKQVLNFIGIEDITVIAADSLGASPDRLEEAEKKIQQLAA